MIESDHAQARVTRHRPIRPLPAKAQPACGPVQAQPAYGPVRAIARIRLTSGLSCQAFERSIRDIPAVRSAVRVIGDVDYELRLECPDLAHLGDVLTSLRACRGTEVASTVLVTREVEGLGRRARSIAGWGTAPRPRQTRSA